MPDEFFGVEDHMTVDNSDESCCKIVSNLVFDPCRVTWLVLLCFLSGFLTFIKMSDTMNNLGWYEVAVPAVIGVIIYFALPFTMISTALANACLNSPPCRCIIIRCRPTRRRAARILPISRVIEETPRRAPRPTCNEITAEEHASALALDVV